MISIAVLKKYSNNQNETCHIASNHAYSSAWYDICDYVYWWVEHDVGTGAQQYLGTSYVAIAF